MKMRTVFMLFMATAISSPYALPQSGKAGQEVRSINSSRKVHQAVTASLTTAEGDSVRGAASAAPQNLAPRPPSIMDVVEGEVFLMGNFIEVGIHGAGSFGTSVEAPPGFHPLLDGESRQLGFVVDPGQDGWEVGEPPQSGDFFVPGSPEEGWTVEWTVDGVERTFNNVGLEGEVEVPMTSLDETSSGDTRSAVWEGTATNGDEMLRITQTVTFDVNDLFFVINVVLTNVGSVPLDSVEYMRNVDPDQEQPLTGSFTTSNFVANQPERTGHPNRPDLVGRPVGNVDTALVVARGLEFGITLGLGAIDSRATVSNEGFANRDPDEILNTPIEPTEESPNIADQAIALAFDLGSLAPGQSISFDYTYVLNEEDLAVALGQLAAVTILQPTGTVSGDNVLFQATTNDVPNTVQIEFFVNDESIGIDTTPDAGGVFERTFNSLTLANGPANLRAVASFADESTAEKSTTVTVDNSGPPMDFVTPTSGQAFSGDNIPIEIEVLDPSQPPVRVSFFRETASTGSLFLGEDTEEPFTSSFDVSDLPEGETVVIKAVGTDALDRTTTIQVSGSVSSNLPPIAVNDTVATDEDTPLTIGVLTNDSDPNEDPVALVELTQTATNGNAVIDLDGGTITYTPNADFNGVDQFAYSISDGELADTALVVVTVNPVNDRPVALNDAVETDEDMPVTIPVLRNDTDIDGGPLTIIEVTQGENGTVEITGGSVNGDRGTLAVDPADTTVTYTPNPNFNGVDNFTYVVDDGNGGLDTASVAVTVNPVNDAPLALSDTAFTDQGAAVTIPVLRNDTDIEGDELAVSAVTQASNGSVAVDAGDSTVTYTPNPGFSGVDSFNYIVDDGNGGVDTASVHVVVRDIEAPGPPMNLMASPSGWTNADTIYIRWQNPPDSSGIAGLRFTVDSPPTSDEDGTFVPGAGIDSVGIPTGPDLRGTHTAYIWLVDGDGNSDFNNHDSVTVRYDDLPPTTMDDVVPSGWYNGDAKIELTAADSLSGVEATFFRVDGGQVQQGTRPTVKGEGRNHTLEYWSTDRAGNQEAVKSSRPIHIDLTPPSGKATSAEMTAGQRISVAYEASDNLSGVKYVELWFRKDFSFWIRQTETYTSSPILFEPTFGEGTYGFVVTPVDSAGNREARGDTAEVSVLFSTTGVATEAKIPKEYVLEQNFPNPFNPSTTLRYGLPKPSTVRLEIYNLLGQKVRTLVSSDQPAGTYVVQWDGTADNGRQLPSGVYLYRMQAGSFVAVRKMVLVE